MIPIKVCFLGTPPFAAQHLRALLNNPNYRVVGVVTQPDRPTGRKMQVTASAVKTLALMQTLPVLTPENIRKDADAIATIKSWNADVAVVVAFGQILSQDFLESFQFGAVNVHGSLLPRWRGAAPIQRALEAGDTETGVALQQMVKKLDAGAIIGERRLPLSPEITATEVYDKLAEFGSDLLNDDLFRFIKGEINPREQDESKVTIAPKIEKTESLLNWNMPAVTIHNRVRAYTMGPGTYVLFQGKRLKILRTSVADKSATGNPGTIVTADSTGLRVQTQQGIISLLELQPESKSRMTAADFLKSTVLKRGDLFV